MQDSYTFAGTDHCRLPEKAHIALSVNLYTRIRAVRPSMRTAFGHLKRAPHYFQTLGWIGFIYGLMMIMGPIFSQYHPHLWPEGQGHGRGSL